MPNKAHKATDEMKLNVKAMTAFGLRQEDICTIMEISLPTLHKYYRRELDIGAAEANAKVVKSLFDQAVSGNTAAAIFWTKVRMGWSETVRHAGPDGGPVEVMQVTRKVIDAPGQNRQSDD